MASGNQSEQEVESIFNEITAKIQQPETQDRSFICDYDLKEIWHHGSRIAIVVPSIRDNTELRQFVQNHMLTILSILIYSGAHSQFCNLLSGNNQPIWKDSHLPLRDHQLSFIHSTALRRAFQINQHLFLPVRIHEPPPRIVIPQERRLPLIWKDDNIGEGGFGEVSLVEIPPGYLVASDTGRNGDPVVRACKRIETNDAFQRERDNLELLKESIRHHDAIMLHHVIIEHGLNHYILFPYAEYGDLELFLHCGFFPWSPTPRKKYDWETEFVTFDSRDSRARMWDMIRQCANLADAIKWLHEDIMVIDTSIQMFCAHMDLKPANILIRRSERDHAGRWMISDFGISAFKEHPGGHDPAYGTIRDLYMTMNTRPKRGAGTYQAPEVADLDAFSNAQFASRGHGTVGRRSDIWSFGCILSEVLTFALGKHSLINDFEQQRIEQNGSVRDNYYYSKSQSNSLHPNQRNLYTIRPAVTQWLDDLSIRHPIHRPWIEPCANTIKRILVADPTARPDARRLLTLVMEAKDHVNPRDSNSPMTPPSNREYSPSSGSPISPLRFRTSTFPPSPLPAFSPMPASPTQGNVSSVFSEHGAGQAGSNVWQSQPLPNPTASPTSPSQSLYPTHIFGGNLHPNEAGPSGTQAGRQMTSEIFDLIMQRQRTPNSKTVTAISSKGGKRIKGKDVAIAETANIVAYLVDSTIQVVQIDLLHQKARPLPNSVISLDSSGKWTRVAVAGDFLAVWGKTKSIHIYNWRRNTRVHESDPDRIDLFRDVVVSSQGIMAIICDEKIIVRDVRSPSGPFRIAVNAGETFASAAFNDKGDILIAWSYGREIHGEKVGSLCAWRVDNSPSPPQTSKALSSFYPMCQTDDPNSYTPIPFNSSPGCIIATPENKFYPAQHRKSTDNTLSREYITIDDYVASCIFENQFFITIEKSWWQTRLKVYQIKNGDIVTLEQLSSREICTLKTSVKKTSRLRAIQMDQESVTFVVCNLDGLVELVNMQRAGSEGGSSSNASSR